MDETTPKVLLQEPGETKDEHSLEELKVQNKSTEVTFETKDYEVTAGCVAVNSDSSSSSDEQDEDDQDETYFAVSLSPKGIRTSRKRPKKWSKHSPIQKKMRTIDMEKKPLVLAKAETGRAAAQEEKSRAETALEKETDIAQVARELASECAFSESVRIMVLVLFVFVVFVHLTMMMVVTVCS